MADDIARSVAARLDGPLGVLGRELRQLSPPAGLGVTASRALAHLVEASSPMSSADLARAEGLRPQSMSAVVARLETHGLVTREPDPADGRRRLLVVTRAGRRRVRAASGHLEIQLAVALASGFSEVELELLDEVAPVLERLARALR